MYKTNHEFQQACSNQDIKLIKKLMNEGTNDWNMSWGLHKACTKGNIVFVKKYTNLIIKHGGTPSWNLGLEGACSGGHMSTAKFTIDCGANDWNSGLGIACQNGHVKLAKFMIKKGANNFKEAWWRMEIGKSLEILKLLLFVQQNYHELRARGTFLGERSTLVWLLENGIPQEILKKIEGTDYLFQEITEFKNRTSFYLDFLYKELVGLVAEYCII